ncbi:hypothetical protein [Kaistia sp. MMO-174]|uniref:hypothetical protein n=1 Tax=Kaistia sp. MMO-174 TaxID=3081256 RepID=UPI0030174D9F
MVELLLTGEQMVAPHWSLNESRTRLVVDFPTDPPVRFDFDADEVDEFIANLAMTRAAMLPPPPIEADPDPGSLMQVSHMGRWYVHPMPDREGIALLLLVPGYRWIGLWLDRAGGERLIEIVRHALDHPR